MSNVTEMSLDDLDSSVPNVSIERIDEPTPSTHIPVVATEKASDGIEDLDLLVDPAKSRNSPVPATSQTLQSDQSSDISKPEPLPLEEPKVVAVEKDDIDFQIKVARAPEKPVSSTFSSFTPVQPTPSRNDGVERQEMLFKLKRLESRGIPLSKHYSSSSSLQDMKDEYARLKHQRDLENSIKFQRKSMMAFASGVEFLNSKFDPFDIKLDGWSESLHENLSDYDDVFEELHEKYKAKAKIAPELKLLMMLGGSAVMFHMTNSLFKSTPQVDEILKNNPDLARQFASAAVSSSTQNNPGLGHVLGDMLDQSAPSHPTFIPPQPSFVPDAPPPPTGEEMAGPKDQDVERILNQINEFREEPVTTAPQTVSQPTREVNISTDVPVKKRRGRPPKNRPDTSSFAKYLILFRFWCNC